VKTWSITLSLLCAAGIALADDKAQAPAVQPEAAAVTEKAAPAKPKHHRAAGKAKRLPRGDLRRCLELKDNMAIIQCAENRRNN
jgi:hypothetical protein